LAEVQVGDRGRAERRRVGAADGEVTDHAPTAAELVGPVPAEVGVVEDARRGRGLELVDAGDAADDGDGQLAVPFVDVVAARGRLALVAGGEAERGDRVRRLLALDHAVLVAEREAHWT